MPPRLPRSPERNIAQGFGNSLAPRVLPALVLLGCNTYDPSLLLPAQDAREPVTPGNGGTGPSPASGGGGSGGEGPAPPGPTSRGGNGGAPAPTTTSSEPGGAGGDGGADAGPDAGLGGSPDAGPPDAGVSGEGPGGAGSGGEGGQGGSRGGEGGVAGAAGGGAGGLGGAGNGGMGGGGGSAGMPNFDTCSGCARLTVPLDAATDYAHYTVVLPEATDLTGATIGFLLRRVAGTGGTFRGYVQQGPDDSFGIATGADTPIASLTTGMMLINWNLTTVDASFDLTAIARIGVEVSAEGSTSWTNPTVIDLDLIQVTDAVPQLSGWTFGTASTVYTTPVEVYSAGPMWLNSYAEDTTAAGSAIEWVGQ